jgi:serine/threonine protein kinase
MPAPFSPDPADSSSVRRRASDSAPNDTDPNATPLAGSPAANEPPTVITARIRRAAADPKLGESLAGRRLGHFELIETVGAGGMAAVLKARDLDLGRVVALKILPPDLAADPENVVRFKQEARAAARLDHDNVARVYFFGEDQGLHFIAFEFVEGDNLRQLMDAHGGPIPIPEAVSVLLQVTAGLQHAVERGVVHRDIKPSNIIVTPDGRAKIVDMGLAR